MDQANGTALQLASRRDLRTRCERGKENRTKIAAHISRLMAHYWAANEDPRLRAAVAQDWLDDLAIFHEAIVAEACRDWRQGESRRPTPSDIRKLCLESTKEPEPPPSAPPPETAEELQARLEHRREMGDLFGVWQRMHRGEIPYPPPGVSAIEYAQQILERERS